jgi:hypothetical protein
MGINSVKARFAEQQAQIRSQFWSGGGVGLLPGDHHQVPSWCDHLTKGADAGSQPAFDLVADDSPAHSFADRKPDPQNGILIAPIAQYQASGSETLAFLTDAGEILGTGQPVSLG